ncbi:glycosyltransferase family 1 protein [Bifidobacterium tissieri]|uniref:Glycosyltransferase family 1 protein n=2 Tax=Bifidobacterium tissieri TaxID=1630162 RepID=A0A5M9ZH29_9BIFI|nr:glycosyltransferase family 1 protein [Bifidobacterium tissieri]KAA8831946.1 glycosyltransferase family 1 protein [Bifidobacterium tissieri]
MKRICLIAPGLLPVPATQGGAIETLMTSLIEENEKHGLLDLTVVTPYDDESRRWAERLRHTRFMMVSSPSRSQRIRYRGVHAVVRRALPSMNHLPNAFYLQALHAIRHETFDAVMLEGGPAEGLTAYDRLFPGKMWYHLHYTPAADQPFDSSASRVIAVSDFARRRWTENCTSRQRVITVRNGIGISRFMREISQSERAEIRSSLGFADADFVVMYCGRIIPEKGILELLDAIGAIDDDHVKLMIVGSSNFGPSERTPYVDQVVASANRLGDRAVFTGYVNNDDLYRFSKSADIQVVPSIWEEAAGLVVVEGMAAGLPLVVTDSGGIQEYASPECSITVERGDGLANSLADAIVALRDDPDRRRAMGEAGRHRARSFSTEAMYRQFVDACEQQ